MTHTNYTRKILRIEDNKIYFNEDCLEIRKEDNKEYNIFHGYLTYNPKYCVHCGCVNNGTLPESFGIDELTATKDTKGKKLNL